MPSIKKSQIFPAMKQYLINLSLVLNAPETTCNNDIETQFYSST